MGNLESLGNQFRYLSLVVGMFAGATVLASKSFVTASIDMDNALIGLRSVAAGTGNAMNDANKVAMHFAKTGLMSVADAAMSLKQLLAKGYGLKQATDLMNVMTDAAVFNRQANLSIGQAIRGTAEGIKNDMSMKTDNTGITKNLSIMEKEYAKSIGKTGKALTKTEKLEAVYQGFMKEGALFKGNAALATQTLGGEMSKLGAITLQTKAALGETLAPIVGNLTELLSTLFMNIENFAKKHAFLVGMIIAFVTALSVLLAVVATVGALLPMLSTGMVGISTLMVILSSQLSLLTARFFGAAAAAKVYAFFTAIAGWSTLKLTFIIIAVVAGIALLIYSVLKLTGKWDKYKNTLKKITGQITITKNGIKDLSSTVDNSAKTDEKARRDKEIVHRRRLEDLTQALKEEQSKGVWADQTRIRDLKKRIKRENEDWGWYLNDLKGTGEKESTIFDKMHDRLQRMVKMNTEAVNEIQKSWMLSDTPILKAADAMVTAFNSIKKMTFHIALPFSKEWTIENLSGGIDLILEWSKKLSSRILDNMKTGLNVLISSFKDWGINIKNSIISGIIGVVDWAKNLPLKILNGMKTGTSNLWQGFKDIGKRVKDNIAEGYNNPPTILQKIQSGWSHLWDMLKNTYRNIPLPFNMNPNLPKYQEGGTIPGTTGTAVPIIAHAGETVIPAGSSPITININNPSVRSNQDIISIANAVKSVLSRQQVLRHLT